MPPVVVDSHQQIEDCFRYENRISLRRVSTQALCAAIMILASGTWLRLPASMVMTDLTADGLMVTLTQVVTQLPVLLFVVIGEAVADFFGRRRCLALTNDCMFVISALLGIDGLPAHKPALLLVPCFAPPQRCPRDSCASHVTQGRLIRVRSIAGEVM